MRINQRALRFIQGGLLALCVFFVGFTAYELVRPYRLPPAASQDRSEPTATTDESTTATTEDPTDRTIPPVSAFSEIIERPLFMADRKPFAPPVPAQKRPASTPEMSEQVLLSAVVISDEQRVALVYTDKDNKLQQLRQGEVFKGWTLTELRPSGIFLRKGQRVRYVELVVAPSRPAAAQEDRTQRPGSRDGRRRPASPRPPADRQELNTGQPDETSDEKSGLAI